MWQEISLAPALIFPIYLDFILLSASFGCCASQFLRTVRTIWFENHCTISMKVVLAWWLKACNRKTEHPFHPLAFVKSATRKSCTKAWSTLLTGLIRRQFFSSFIDSFEWLIFNENSELTVIVYRCLWDEKFTFLCSLRSTEEEPYNYDVEDFLLRVIFHNLYNFGSFVSYCMPYKDSVDQTKCPETNYRQYAELVSRFASTSRNSQKRCDNSNLR